MLSASIFLRVAVVIRSNKLGVLFRIEVGVNRFFVWFVNSAIFTSRGSLSGEKYLDRSVWLSLLF